MRASILTNTNKAVSSTEDAWGTIRSNTYARFGSDEHFYSIVSAEPLFYIKDFDVLDQSRIQVNTDVGINLIPNDCLSLSFKEYELLTVHNLIDPGKGYQISDVVSLKGGLCQTDPKTGLAQNCQLTVVRVNSVGGIEQLRLENAGKYITTPDLDCDVSGGNGDGARINVEFTLIENRALIEKTILNIDRQPGISILFLDSPLPKGVEDGKLSAQKWQLYLSSNYAGDGKLNDTIEFMRDFTPNYGIPLLNKGSLAPETIYNLAADVIDKALKDLQSQIDILKTPKNPD